MFGNTLRSATISFARLLLQETGTYNTMFNRPYVTNPGVDTVNNIVNRISEYGDGRVNGSILAGIATDWVKPSASVEGVIDIPNGWNERRIRFILEAHVQYQTGAYMIYYFQGYTNYPGVSMNGNVAPDMEFIINSVIGVSRSERMTPMGIQTVDVVTETSQIMADQGWSLASQHDARYTMRPQDIFVGMQHLYLNSDYNVSSPNDLFDARAVLRRDPIQSSRSNNMPTNYIAKVIDNFSTANTMSFGGQSSKDVISTARQQVMEMPASENVVLRALSDRRGMGITNRFTFNDLSNVDNNLPNVTNFITLGGTQQAQIHHAGQTAFWEGSDLTTQAATILSQSVPALMMELMISRIVFRSTNQDFSAQMNTAIIDAKSLTNADMTRNFEIFKMRLETELLRDISMNGMIQFMLEMTVDVCGETWINISLDSKAPIQFVTPSFCDNLYSPVITTNRENFINLANDFDGLLNNVIDGVNRAGAIKSYNPGI